VRGQAKGRVSFSLRVMEFIQVTANASIGEARDGRQRTACLGLMLHHRLEPITALALKDGRRRLGVAFGNLLHSNNGRRRSGHHTTNNSTPKYMEEYYVFALQQMDRR